jgi:diguanylate cyclase (GGDEF)-like protein/PAS domain S-box-containing protein
LGRRDRLLIAASVAGVVTALILARLALTGSAWAVTAGWVTSSGCAALAALACLRVGCRAGLIAVRRPVWLRLSGAIALVAVLALVRLGEWVATGPGRADRIGVLDAVAHAVVVMLFVAPLYRLPSNARSRVETLALTIEVAVFMLVAAVYVWFFVVRDLSHGQRITAPLVVACAAVLVSALAGVLFGVRTVLTGFSSPYRTMLLRLGAVTTVGGLALGPWLLWAPYDLDGGPLFVPLACLVVVLGARPGGEQTPLSPAAVRRWQRRYRLLPFFAVAAIDALLLVVLVVGSRTDRLVVGVGAVVLTAVTVVRQVALERETRMREQRFRQLVQNSYDVVTINDRGGAITYMSGGSQRMFGRQAEQRTGGNIFELLHPDDQPRIKAVFAEVETEPGGSRLWRARFRHADGTWRQIEVLTTNLLDEPSVRGVVCNTRDVTDAYDLAQRLSYDATHDGLTGLANRALFRERLTASLAAGQRLSLVLADLNDFKVVNDTLGHAAGDHLLIAVAERLRRAVRADDTVARLGGDEFGILLPGQGRSGVERVLSDIITELRVPVSVAGRDLVVPASFGVVAGQPGDDAGDLMRRADIAMYEAKARGEGGWQHYLPGMQARGAELDQATADLRRGLDAGELCLYYQPVVDLGTGGMVGAEALVRWQHRTRGMVGPLEFIGVAEQSDLIVDLGRWVLREACRQAAQWIREHPAGAPQSISVNVSARQLREPGFAGDVAAALRDNELDPARLIIEITESTAVGGRATDDSLIRLRRLGVRLALDDFGTGQSTLTLLATCPVDQIKLDRSFVPGLMSDVIAAAVLQLARGFGVEAVAEGVETAEQAEHLRALGYDRAQGFHFARPMPAADLGALMSVAVG